MKVLYDHQIFQNQTIGGISRYFAELYVLINKGSAHQAEITCLYSRNKFLKEYCGLEVMGKYCKDYQELLPAFKKLPAKGRLYKFLRFVGLLTDYQKENNKFSLAKIKSGNYDVFHPTYYDPYFLDKIGNKPFVLTVHDMIHEILPTYVPVSRETTERKKDLIAKASRIIAISNNTKRDLIRLFGVPENKIDVIYHGNSLTTDKVAICPTLNLPKKYILFIGERGLYKNFALFLQAVAPLLIQDPSLYLVCSGSSFTGDELKKLNAAGITDKVVQYKADDDQLACLYQNALVFVFPSLYEGFGIPVLEAFSCDCPIVLSNTSSLPEVAGDAALYFDPNEQEDMRQKIDLLIKDKDLRMQLVAKGRERLKMFSWENTVKQTLETYAKAIAGK